MAKHFALGGLSETQIICENLGCDDSFRNLKLIIFLVPQGCVSPFLQLNRLFLTFSFQQIEILRQELVFGRQLGLKLALVQLDFLLQRRIIVWDLVPVIFLLTLFLK